MSNPNMRVSNTLVISVIFKEVVSILYQNILNPNMRVSDILVTNVTIQLNIERIYYNI